jgi:hypothetical protein
MLDSEICSLKSRGRRQAQLSGDLWCDFPRVGGSIPPLELLLRSLLISKNSDELLGILNSRENQSL